MLNIKEIMRNNHGEIINIILDDGRRVDVKQLFSLVQNKSIGGAYIQVDDKGNQQLHITCDGDTGTDLDCLSLI
ncbi:MAG TPA: DUF3892 domain-containing protein [Syntrophomonadaceae bacterium]|nr:DUF3892 domain-containing protein [Syntrophomonadaceae bacterium]